MVQTINSSPQRGTKPKSQDNFFTEIDASWVHHLHEEALVITTKIAHNLIHWVLIDSGRVVIILYWNAYQKMWLKQANLCSTTSPLYWFTGESVIPKRTIKLATTLREAPQMMTIVIDFLVVNYPSAYNGVLGRPLLRTLKAITSVQGLTMKFLTMAGIGQV